MKQRKSRSAPEVSRQVILNATMELAGTSDYHLIRRDDVAKAAEVSPALVSHYFGTMIQFRRTIMREAIRTGNLYIIACGLMHKEPHAMACDSDIKQRALEIML